MAGIDPTDLFRQRMSVIAGIGQKNTAFAQNKAETDAAQSRALEQISSDRLNSIEAIKAAAATRSAGQVSDLSGGLYSGGGGGDFNSFVSAIRQQESGGRYNARNASGASGAYQIMRNNIPSWSREALGHSVGYSTFMKSPEIQDAIAKYKLQQYYNKYGAAGAAVAWYAGEGNARRYRAGGGNWSQQQGNYPSIQRYINDILRRMSQ